MFKEQDSKAANLIGPIGLKKVTISKAEIVNENMN